LEVRGYLEMALKCLGYSVELAQDGDEVVSYLEAANPHPDAILLDLMMPNRDGLDTLREVRRIDPSVPVIVVSGANSTMNVVTAIKRGGPVLLSKPGAHDDLRRAILRAFDRDAGDAPPVAATEPATTTFVGTSPRMQEIHVLADQIGWSEAPVLLQGETGCG